MTENARETSAKESNIDRLTAAATSAASWLRDLSQIKNDPPENTDLNFPHRTWVGSVREYDHRLHRWKYFAPVWHTGQAVKAFVMLHRVIADEGYLNAALLGGSFIRSNVVTDGADAGLIMAHEGSPPETLRLPGIPEGLDGIIELAEETGDDAWWNITLDALDWLIRKAYRPDTGTILNWYTAEAQRFEPYTLTPYPDGKPTIDGGVFIKAYQKTGDTKYRDVAIALAERLLADEEPKGNWVCYGPSRTETGVLHPRHAYWYGFPMIAMYDMTGEHRYMDQAVRSAQWYARAMRHDGGLFRGTYVDGSTDSFGHAASGIGCALIMWINLYLRLKDESYLPLIDRGFRFLLTMQVHDAQDPNMRGTIIEKIMPPDGTDSSPYLVRDLGTIFFLQAAALALERAVPVTL